MNENFLTADANERLINDFLVSEKIFSTAKIRLSSDIFRMDTSPAHISNPITTTAKIYSDNLLTAGCIGFPQNSNVGLTTALTEITASSVYHASPVTVGLGVINDKYLTTGCVALDTSSNLGINDDFTGVSSSPSYQANGLTSETGIFTNDSFSKNNLYDGLNDNHASLVTAGLGVINDKYLTTGCVALDTSSNLGINDAFAGVSSSPFYQANGLTSETGIFANDSFSKNNLYDGLNCESTYLYKKHYLDSKLEYNSVGISSNSFSFYSRNIDSMTSFENSVCGILGGLKLNSRPNHIGFEYIQSHEKPIINIYLIFSGPITGDIINIGDKITYMLT